MGTEGHTQAWRRLLRQSDRTHQNQSQHDKKNRWTPTEFSLRVLVIGLGLAILLSISMIILLAKNYHPPKEGIDYYFAAFQRVCENSRRIGVGETAHSISTSEHFICVKGDPRYDRWEIKMIVKRGDLK